MTPLSARLWPVVGAVAAVLVLGMVAVAGALEPIQEVLREKIERLRHFKTLQIGSAFVASTIVVPDFYERRAFRLAWEKRAAVDDLLRAIRDSAADGLDPQDYHLSATCRSLAYQAGKSFELVRLRRLLSGADFIRVPG